jgi:hypothetical protein
LNSFGFSPLKFRETETSPAVTAGGHHCRKPNP